MLVATPAGAIRTSSMMAASNFAPLTEHTEPQPQFPLDQEDAVEAAAAAGQEAVYEAAEAGADDEEDEEARQLRCAQEQARCIHALPPVAEDEEALRCREGLAKCLKGEDEAAAGEEEEKKANPACATLALAYLAALPIPIPIIPTIPQAIGLGVCCPGEVWGKIKQLGRAIKGGVRKVGMSKAARAEEAERLEAEEEKMKAELQALLSPEELARHEEERQREDVLSKHTALEEDPACSKCLKGPANKCGGWCVQQMLANEDEHPWLAYTKLLALYRHEDALLPKPGQARTVQLVRSCSHATTPEHFSKESFAACIREREQSAARCKQKLAGKLAHMKRSHEWLPGVTAQPDEDLPEEILEPEPLDDDEASLAEEEPTEGFLPRAKALLGRGKGAFCKKIAGACSWAVGAIKAAISSPDKMGEEEARLYRERNCQ